MAVKSKLIPILIGILILIVLISAFLVWHTLSQKPEDEVTTMANEVIDLGMEDIGELSTEAYYLTVVQTSENAKQLFGKNIPLTKNRFIYSYDVCVKAGVDFTGVNTEVDTVAKKVNVIIPKAQIFDVTVDNDSFQIYVEENNIFNQISLEDVNASLADMKAAAEKMATEKGILDKAKENAQSLLLNFLQNNPGLEGYTVVLK